MSSATGNSCYKLHENEWCYSGKDSEIVENVRRRASKLVPGLQNLSHDDHLNSKGTKIAEPQI